MWLEPKSVKINPIRLLLLLAVTINTAFCQITPLKHFHAVKTQTIDLMNHISKWNIDRVGRISLHPRHHHFKKSSGDVLSFCPQSKHPGHKEGKKVVLYVCGMYDKEARLVFNRDKRSAFLRYPRPGDVLLEIVFPNRSSEKVYIRAETKGEQEQERILSMEDDRDSRSALVMMSQNEPFDSGVLWKVKKMHKKNRIFHCLCG